VNSKAAMSPEMALRIEKAFGMNMDTLLRMQAWFEGHTMRKMSNRIAVKRFLPKPEVGQERGSTADDR
jgi:antitoxin HigA-1